jgi:signal transduction histidine kinase
MQVDDNGPGVPKRELSRITKRFARLESSRNTAGHGLGLSLVSAVAKLHGGQLILRSEGGLRATIAIPRTATSDRPLSRKDSDMQEEKEEAR